MSGKEKVGVNEVQKNERERKGSKERGKRKQLKKMGEGRKKFGKETERKQNNLKR